MARISGKYKTKYRPQLKPRKEEVVPHNWFTGGKNYWKNQNLVKRHERFAKLMGTHRYTDQPIKKG